MTEASKMNPFKKRVYDEFEASCAFAGLTFMRQSMSFRLCMLKQVYHEIKIGCAFHYLISVVWAVAFHIFLVGYPLFELSYKNGLLFGALTTLAPLFIFMPFTGQGVLARKTQMPFLTSLVLLARHSVFGLAMFEAFSWFH